MSKIENGRKTNEAMVRIVIIDDNLVSEIISSYIEMQDDMEVVGLARDGVDGLSVINETNPDIVILDKDHAAPGRAWGIGAVKRS